VSEHDPKPLAKILDGMERWATKLPATAPPVAMACSVCGHVFNGYESNPICPRCLRDGSPDRSGRLRRAGVPRLFVEEPFVEPATWPKDGGMPAVDLAAWVGEPWSVLLLGAVGSGKTMLAVELLDRSLQTYRSGRFVRCASLPRLLYGPEGDEEYSVLTGVHCLVVDDLGRGTSGRGWDAVGEVCAERHGEKLATIWTSNLNLEQIAQECDAAIADRLSQGLVVTVPGSSRRAP
jgi:hypothetical protein